MTATVAPKRLSKRETVCGVSAIFGHEHDGAAPQLETAANGAQIHLGLARARHAVDHDDVAAAAFDAGAHRIEGAALPFGQLERFEGVRTAGKLGVGRKRRIRIGVFRLAAAGRPLQLPAVFALDHLRRAARGRQKMHARA